jgi:hypothetical protein
MGFIGFVYMQLVWFYWLNCLRINFQFQLGKKYSIFIPMVHKVLMKHKINNQVSIG